MAVDHDAAEQSPELKSYYDNKWLLFSNVFFITIGGSAAGLGLSTAAQTLMPLHMDDIHMSPHQISNAMSLNGWLGLPLVIYLSYLTDHWQSKWGRRLPFLAFSLPFLVVGVFIFPHMRSALTCTLVYGMVAFFSQVKYDTYPLLTYDVAKNRYWGRINGFGFVTSNLFILLGQVWLMPAESTWGKNMVYAVCAGMVLVLTLPAIFLIKEPPIRSKEPPRYNPIPVVWKVLKVGFAEPRNILMFLAYSLVCAQWLVKNYVSLQGKANLGLDDGAIGTEILKWGTIFSVLTSFFMGWAADKIGTAKSVGLGYLMAIAAAYYGFHPSSVSDLRIAYVLSMGSGNFMYIAAVLFVVATVRREDLASFTACNGAVNLFLSATLTNIAGLMIENWFDKNYGLSFMMTLVLGLPAVLIFFYLEAKRARELAEKPVTPAT